MGHALRFDLRAEASPGSIQLDAEGCLTGVKCQALLKVLDRVLTLVGWPRIIVTLSGLGHPDPGGLRALEDHVATRAHDRTTPGQRLLQIGPVVSIQAPSRPRHCCDPETVTAFGGIPLENVVVHQDAAAGRSSATATRVLPLWSAPLRNGPRPMAERGDLLVADSPAVSVWELMSPLGPTVGVTDAVGEAARALQAHGGIVVLVDAARRAVGTLTDADLEAAARQDPAGWRHGRCEQVVRTGEGWARPEDPVEGVVWAYQHGPIRPVLVFNGEQAVGIVHPSTVFGWCTEHLPAVLTALSRRAADQADASQAPSPAHPWSLSDPAPSPPGRTIPGPHIALECPDRRATGTEPERTQTR